VIARFIRAGIKRGPYHLWKLTRHPVVHSRYLAETVRRDFRHYVSLRSNILEGEISVKAASSLEIFRYLMIDAVSSALWQMWFAILFCWRLSRGAFDRMMEGSAQKGSSK